MGEFLGVDAVILVFAAVDGAHVEGMGEDEGEAGFLAGVAEPVPVEHALAADGQVVAVGGDEFEEELEVVVCLMLVWTSFLPWRSMTQTIAQICCGQVKFWFGCLPDQGFYQRGVISAGRSGNGAR